MPQNLAMDFLQGASNAAASNVSGPVDLLAFALRKMGFPVPEDPVLGAKWMADRGITVQPQNKVAGMLGETAGMVGPIAAAARAPEIASGMLQAGDNLAAPRTLNPQTGAVVVPYSGKSFAGFETMEEMLADRAKREAEAANLKAAWERVKAGWPIGPPAPPVQWRRLDQVAPTDWSKSFAGMSEAEYARVAKKHMQPPRGKK